MTDVKASAASASPTLRSHVQQAALGAEIHMQQEEDRCTSGTHLLFPGRLNLLELLLLLLNGLLSSELLSFCLSPLCPQLFLHLPNIDYLFEGSNTEWANDSGQMLAWLLQIHSKTLLRRLL